MEDSLFTFIIANEVRKGDIIMLSDCPCRIISYTSSKTGKHGSMKIHFCGIDVITSNKKEQIYSSSDKIKKPFINLIKYTLIDITEDDYLSLMNEGGEIKENIKIENNIGKELKKVFMENKEQSKEVEISVTIMSLINYEIIYEFKII